MVHGWNVMSLLVAVTCLRRYCFSASDLKVDNSACIPWNLILTEAHPRVAVLNLDLISYASSLALRDVFVGQRCLVSLDAAITAPNRVEALRVVSLDTTRIYYRLWCRDEDELGLTDRCPFATPSSSKLIVYQALQFNVGKVNKLKLQPRLLSCTIYIHDCCNKNVRTWIVSRWFDSAEQDNHFWTRTFGTCKIRRRSHLTILMLKVSSGGVECLWCKIVLVHSSTIAVGRDHSESANLCLHTSRHGRTDSVCSPPCSRPKVAQTSKDTLREGSEEFRTRRL